jgi:hypothetical protein
MCRYEARPGGRLHSLRQLWADEAADTLRRIALELPKTFEGSLAALMDTHVRSAGYVDQAVQTVTESGSQEVWNRIIVSVVVTNGQRHQNKR